ncbi:trypsin-like peptidase domain-containing protein [Streptomyces sp. NPDC045714]|uniref:VMAP-C domain-containing protein n=1 Tax=Streptomyces sp. NPDC045714 TaxID=3154913 RepID=UPI0033D45DDF
MNTVPKAQVLQNLQRLLTECRVFVDGESTGSGFFVAPGLVVSCAHVAGAGVGGRVIVKWQGRSYVGIVLSASEPPSYGMSLWPFPDLAVVELLDSPQGHPCVLLDPQLPWDESSVTAAGYTSVLDDTPAPRKVVLTVRGDTGYQNGELLELHGGEVNRGLSGGPVLSHVSGAVCALVKATRAEGTNLGGYGVSLSALRLLDPQVYVRLITAHDAFHDGDSRWSGLSDRITADRQANDPENWSVGQLTDPETRRFHRLLSDLSTACPGQGTHLESFLAAAPPGTSPPQEPPLTHRDVFTELAALMPPADGGLPPTLAYCADLFREGKDAPALLGDIHDQVLIAAGRLGLGEHARSRLAGAQGEDHLPSVIGRLRHSARDHTLYRVMAWRHVAPDRFVPAGPESEGLALPEALDLLAETLAAEIDLMGGISRPGLIELILPHELIDEDFADWTLWPDSQYSTLGRKQQVVVRPLERHENTGLRHAWQQRWERLAEKTVDEVLVCVCGRGKQRQVALDATFNTNPSLSALVLAGSPRSEPVRQAYQVAVASGVPLMLWSRGAEPAQHHDLRPCGIPLQDLCPASAFFTQMRTTLEGAQRDDVPARICALRNAAAIEDTTDHIGERVVVLWDDPLRQVPRTRLAPVSRAEEGTTQ